MDLNYWELKYVEWLKKEGKANSMNYVDWLESVLTLHESVLEKTLGVSIIYPELDDKTDSSRNKQKKALTTIDD